MTKWNKSSFLVKWNEIRSKRDKPIPNHRIQVKPLDAEQRMQLVEQWTGENRGEFAPKMERLIDESGGNPFLLELLVDNFRQHRDHAEIGLSELVKSRLDRLPSEATSLLQAIAIAGQASYIEEVAETAGLSGQPLSLLTHMRSEKLVRLIGSKDDLRIDTWHDKVRETVLEQLEPAHRRSLHLRLAEFLEDLDTQDRTAAAERISHDSDIHPRLFDLAYHFTEADDLKAFRYLFLAGQRALSTYAIDEALAYLNQAQKRLPSDSDQTTRFSLQLALAKATLSDGQVQASQKLFEDALALARLPFEEAECQIGLGRVWLKRGDLVKSTDAFSKAYQLLDEPVPETKLGQLYMILTSLTKTALMPQLMRWGPAKKTSQEQIQLVSEASIDFQHSLLSDFLRLGAFMLGQGAKAKSSESLDRQLSGYSDYLLFVCGNGWGRLSKRPLAYLERCISECQSEEVNGHTRNNMGNAYYYLGQFEKSEQYLREAANQFLKLRSRSAGLSYHFLRHIESMRGSVSSILDWADKEFRFAKEHDDRYTLAYSQYGHADGLGRAGQVDEAIRLAGTASESLRSCECVTWCIADQELGRALLQASRYERAREILHEARDSVARNFLFIELMLDIYPLLTEAILETKWIPSYNGLESHRLRDSQRMARKSRFHCLKFPTLKPHALRVSGRAATAAGRKKQALKYFDKAIAAAEAIGAHYEHARSLIDKSLLSHSNAENDRQRGVTMLTELSCVLPAAEQEYLGIDMPLPDVEIQNLDQLLE